MLPQAEIMSTEIVYFLNVLNNGAFLYITTENKGVRYSFCKHIFSTDV